jgi:ABC-type transport system substrate-binding protein
MGGEFDYLSVDRQLWNSYHSKGAANNRHVKDADLDKMLDDSRAIFDQDQYATKIKEITKYITDHAINIALPNGTNPTGTQPWVKGWFFDASAGALLEQNWFEDIWIAKH